MRTPEEIRALKQKLERHNEVAEQELRQLTTDGERFDEVAGVYNGNEQLLCALRWVLGEDTILVTPREPVGEVCSDRSRA